VAKARTGRPASLPNYGSHQSVFRREAKVFAGSWDRSRAPPYANKKAFGSRVFKQDHQIKNRDDAPTSRLPQAQWERTLGARVRRLPGSSRSQCPLAAPPKTGLDQVCGGCFSLSSARRAASLHDRPLIRGPPPGSFDAGTDCGISAMPYGIADGPVGMPEKNSRSDLCVDQTPPRTWPVQSQGVIKPLPI
jgi:hypothetical protein